MIPCKEQKLLGTKIIIMKKIVTTNYEGDAGKNSSTNGEIILPLSTSNLMSKCW